MDGRIRADQRYAFHYFTHRLSKDGKILDFPQVQSCFLIRLLVSLVDAALDRADK